MRTTRALANAARKKTLKDFGLTIKSEGKVEKMKKMKIVLHSDVGWTFQVISLSDILDFFKFS
jgi:hypothetical protein